MLSFHPWRPGWTPDQLEAFNRGCAEWAAGRRFAHVDEEDRCVNFGAEECTGRAEENGWCSGCWALIDPAAAS